MTAHDDPPVIDKPLSVDVVGDEIVVSGEMPVTASLTRDAALETGIDLVNAALGITKGRR